MKHEYVCTTVYIAEDGKRFLEEKDCERYEKRAPATEKIEWLRKKLATIAKERNYSKKSLGRRMARLEFLKRKFDEVVTDRHRFSDIQFFNDKIVKTVNDLKEIMELVNISKVNLAKTRAAQRVARCKLDELSKPGTRRRQ